MIENIALSNLRPPKYSLRKSLGEIDELAASIAEKGLMQPLVVRPIENGDYEVIAGERRYNALLKIAADEAPCSIIQVDDKAAFELALTENIQRKTLDPVEEAEAYRKYVVEFGWGGVSDLAEKISKSQPYVSQAIKRAGISSKALELISQRIISKSHADEIGRVSNPEQQDALADIVSKNSFNEKQTRAVVDEVVRGRSIPEAVQSIQQASQPPAQQQQPVALDTAQAIITEIVRRRDLGQYYFAFYGRLHDKISSISIYNRVLDAIANRKPLEECLAMLNVQAGVTSARSDYPRQTQYTGSAITLGNALQQRKAIVEFEREFEREGETTREGKPKQYVADLVIEDKLIVEVEGSGSASADNPDRDNFFIKKGYRIKHVSNEDVKFRLPQTVEEVLRDAGLPFYQSKIPATPSPVAVENPDRPVLTPKQQLYNAFDTAVEESHQEVDVGGGQKQLYRRKFQCPGCHRRYLIESGQPLPEESLLKFTEETE